jgi:homoserine kinase
MKNIFRSAMDAGALGVFLSGAGSTVLALTQGREVTIGYEMADAAAKSGIGGTVRIAQPSPRGVEVLNRE